MKKHLLLIMVSNALFLSGCLEDSSNGDTPNPFAKNIVNEHIQGEWQSDEFVESGALVSYSWSFKGTEYVKTLKARSGSGDTNTDQISGTYSSTDSIVVKSGVTAQTIDLSYVDSYGETVTKLDIVYVKNDELFFGLEKLNENCEGEYYEVTTKDIDIVNGQVVGITEKIQCYSRPDALDFDRAYRSVP